MKLTKQRLKKIIQEELLSELNPPAHGAFADEGPFDDTGEMHLGGEHEHSTDEYHDLMRRVEELVEAWTPPTDNEVALQYRQDLTDLVTDFGCGCKDMGDELPQDGRDSSTQPMTPPLVGTMY